MEKIGGMILLWFLVGAKFVLGPGSALALGLSKLESVLFVFGASSFWCLVLFYAGTRIQKFFREKFPSKKKKPVFTKKNRKIVSLKNKFGAWGIAALIPIISIPISALLASKYFKHDKYIWIKYIVVCAFWTVVLTYFSEPIVNGLKSLWT
ncbi:hypothetical protein [Luteibaculum oceani]|uniref:Small multi-drug export protein n=1 Tax=Luteibaculum oceani TaxID=1294296 RepID=A0A5C6VAY8_9FLAO|nr:hypothetical protein [Luteibaculum oceani]TXC81741.1 hypothetical protein FRX97_04290 [Luteibaculum oceani]